jgi:hypothetical protein
MPDYDEPDNFDTGEVKVDDTIVIQDTMRRDSKIPSSLGFTYVDEKCSKIVKPVNSPYPTDTVQATEPRTPLVTYGDEYGDEYGRYDDERSAARLALLKDNAKNVKKYDEKKEDFYSEMWDDTDLKPKPEVDSPYGFVYFPNKYWKMWHQKAPVCNPVKGACKVLPTYTEGTPVNVLDYTQIGSIMPKFEYKEEYD